MNKIKRQWPWMLLVATIAFATFEIVTIDAPYDTSADEPNLGQVWHATGGFSLSTPVRQVVLAKFVNPDGSATWALYMKVTHFSRAAGWKRISETVATEAGEGPPDVEPSQELIGSDGYTTNQNGETMFAQNTNTGVLEILVPTSYSTEGPLVEGVSGIGDNDNYCGPGTRYDCVYL